MSCTSVYKALMAVANFPLYQFRGIFAFTSKHAALNVLLVQHIDPTNATQG